MYERILVPLDGSSRSEAALPHAERLASSFDSEVLLLWVLTHEAGDRGSSPAQDYVEGLRARLKSAGISARTMTVVDGDTASAILRVAAEERISLVCGAGCFVRLDSGVAQI
jgi:nucleotide-binding universal stress UspA family protein